MCGIVLLSTKFLMLQRCQDTVTFTQNNYFLSYLGGRYSPKGGAPSFSPNDKLHAK